jgi:hypothetical protein
VGGVGGEHPLTVEHPIAFGDTSLHAVEHPVDGACEGGELVGRPIETCTGRWCGNARALPQSKQSRNEAGHGSPSCACGLAW